MKSFSESYHTMVKYIGLYEMALGVGTLYVKVDTWHVDFNSGYFLF